MAGRAPVSEPSTLAALGDPLYLLAADVVNTVLCAILTFSDRPLYSAYETVPRLFGTTVLSDQVAAGVIMWIPGSVMFSSRYDLAISTLSPSRALLSPVRWEFHLSCLATAGTAVGCVATI